MRQEKQGEQKGTMEKNLLSFYLMNLRTFQAAINQNSENKGRVQLDLGNSPN